MDNTISEVLSFVEENDVKFIRLTFCDLFGVPKNVSIMPGELERAFTEGISFEQSAVEGFQNAPSTLYLKPDAGTVSALPWRPSAGRVIRFFCDIVTSDGTPYEGCARSILKRAVAHAARHGLSCQVGTECEFYLFKTDEFGEPTLTPHDHAGYADIAPLDRGENVRREICLTLEEMGFNPETSHHEAGPGQNEIDFRFSDALSAADNLLAFRAAVKAIAAKHGLYASFLPKPFPNRSGSGMHVNFSLVRDGKNIIHAADGLHDPMSEQFVEGVLRHAPEMAAFLNPLPNSYRRLGQFEAPRGIGWAKNGAGPHIIHVPPGPRGTGADRAAQPRPLLQPLSGLRAAPGGGALRPGRGIPPAGAGGDRNGAGGRAAAGRPAGSPHRRRKLPAYRPGFPRIAAGNLFYPQAAGGGSLYRRRRGGL